MKIQDGSLVSQKERFTMRLGILLGNTTTELQKI